MVVAMVVTVPMGVVVPVAMVVIVALRVVVLMSVVVPMPMPMTRLVCRASARVMILLVIMLSGRAIMTGRVFRMDVLVARPVRVFVAGVCVVFFHGRTLGGKPGARNGWKKIITCMGLACNPRKT